MLASVTMCNDNISNYNSKISDLGPLTHLISSRPVFNIDKLFIKANIRITWKNKVGVIGIFTK